MAFKYGKEDDSGRIGGFGRKWMWSMNKGDILGFAIYIYIKSSDVDSQIEPNFDLNSM